MKREIHGKELEINEELHAYTWGGEFVPGVTTILKCINKPMILPWAVGMTRDYWLQSIKSGRTDYDKIHKESWNAHTRFTKAAANIGSNVHAYAECAIKGLPLPELETDEAKRGVEAFHKWQNAHSVKMKASERLIYSKEYHFAGTCDFIAEIDGVLCVGDFKTSSGIYPEMRLQTAAYQHALQEEKDMTFSVRWIVRFDKKTGEFEAKPFYDFELDFAGFKAALSLHRTLQQIERAG